MSFPDRPSRNASRRTVPAAWAITIALVAAGVAVAVTAGYFALRPAPANGSLTLTDDLGRKVVVPSDPSRVAVLSPSIMDEMYRLGLRDHVIGVDCYAAALGGLSDDYSPDQIALWDLSPSMCVQVGPTFAPAMLANLTPSLVLASTIVSLAAVEQITNELHVPVVMLQPATLSGVLLDDSLLGEIFGVAPAASSLNAELSSELYHASVVTGAATFPSVLLTYSVDPQGYWTFGPGTFGLSLLELAGASSISANATIPYPELSPAQVLLADPHYIIYGIGFGVTASTFAGGPDWSQFSAVRDGNATSINSNWITEPDPTMLLEGLPALLGVFHPGSG